MSVNYDRVCRLCLSSRGELLPIFPTTSSDDSEPPVLASKIKDCVSVQITENDDLPTNVCRKCVDNVHNWHIFKSVCERTQNKLQSLIKKDGSQLEEVNIKSEPLSDEAYDDGVVIDGSYPDSENAGTSSKVQPEGPPILASLGLTPRSDKKYVDPRMDWQRVHAILDIIQDDEVINSLQSAEETDVLQESDHESDTEAELMSDIDDSYIDTSRGYICKDRKLISTTPLVPKAANTQRCVEAKKCRKRKIFLSKQYPQPKYAWETLFTENILELIVCATNENIDRKRKNNGDDSITNMSELKVLIGILYMHGIMRPIHQKCNDLWHNEFGVICVEQAMTYDRFTFLLEHLAFDTVNDDNMLDIMKPIRKVFEMFSQNCRTTLDTGSMVVVDEIIIPVFGPCPFRNASKSKSLNNGIKMILLVDPQNFYVSNLDVITDSYTEPEEIVTKIVHHLSGTKRTVIMDSWYNSVSLADKLMNISKLHCVGALSPKDKAIPPLFLSKYRQNQPVMTGYIDKNYTMTSYITEELKCVNILSNDPRFYKKNSGVVSVYKRHQSSVEVLDVLMHYYTTAQNSNNWALSLFFVMLNIAAINAQVLWSTRNTSSVVQRRLFIRELAANLMIRGDIPIEPIGKKKKKSSIKHYGRVEPDGLRKRCLICSRVKRDRKTKQFCFKCGQFICGEHARVVCVQCRNILANQ